MRVSSSRHMLGVPPSPWRDAAAVARRLRRRVMASLYRWTYFLCLCLIAVSAVLAVDGRETVAAIAVVFTAGFAWTGGLWVVPRSADAYVLGMLKVIRQAETGTASARRLQQLRCEAAINLVEEMGSSDSNSACDQALDALRAVRQVGHGDMALAHRLALAYARRRDVYLASQNLRARNDPASIATSKALVAAVAPAGQSEICSSLLHAVAYKLTPPSRWEAAHVEYVKALKQYCESRERAEEMTPPDVPAVADLASLGNQYERLTLAAGHLLTSLGEWYEGRKP
jgi:hypothetical protein